MDPRRTLTASPRDRAATPAPAREQTRLDEATARGTELIQRGRMIVDVATADLAAVEARLGPFDETTWFFRHALDEARRAWERLRAEFGTRALDVALARPPLALLHVGDPARPAAVFVPIGGRTYRVERMAETATAPRLYRLTRLPDHEDGPYYACRLRDGTTQCDCAEWIYQVADIPDAPPCKHLAALRSLGWV
jgi:hypothetical protein